MTSSKALAEVILKAVNLREGSWDEFAYNQATPLERKYKEFYGVALETACEMVCGQDKPLSEVVFVLLKHHYQDTVEWAKGQT